MGMFSASARGLLPGLAKTLLSVAAVMGTFFAMSVTVAPETMPSDTLLRTVESSVSAAPASFSDIETAPVYSLSADYDREAALDYAAAHWNDGVGDCSDFVAACLRAGGIPADMCGATNIMYFLMNEYGCDRLAELTIRDKKFHMSDNEGVIEAGDPVFWYCASCGKCGHTSICSGADDDILVDYAHNNRHNGHVALWTGSHLGSCHYTSLFVYHLGDEIGTDE